MDSETDYYYNISIINGHNNKLKTKKENSWCQMPIGDLIILLVTSIELKKNFQMFEFCMCNFITLISKYIRHFPPVIWLIPENIL